MTISITHSGTTLNPVLVTGYDWTRPSQNVIHQIIGTSNPAITLRPAGPRTGTLNIFCLDEAEAVSMANLHADVGTFSFLDSEVTSTAMNYVTNGGIKVALDPETRVRWTVAVDYQEII